MAERNPLKQKYPRPAESLLATFLGSDRHEIVQRVLDEMRRRGVPVSLEWTGPEEGWAYVAGQGQALLFMLVIAETPLRGLIEIERRKLENLMIADPRLSDAGRMILESIEREGASRWIELELRTRDDVDAFLDVVSAKQRALGLSGAAAPKGGARRRKG
jgi:hypothetical protein